MTWRDKISRLRAQAAYHHTREQEEHRQARYQMEHLRARQNELRLQQKIYERELKSLLRLRGRHHTEIQTEEEIALLKKIAALKDEHHKIRVEWHMSQFHGERADFKKYYNHINRTRPLVIVLVLALWFLLFWFGGIGVVWKIVILIVALATTVGSFLEIGFSLKVKDRLLRPVENLIEGVSEISRGNYNVTIEEEGISEVSSLVRAFNDMAKKLSESEKVKAEYEENRKALIANISHDLKTPITSIEGYIEAITANRDLPAEKLETYLKVIGQNAAYMDRLIDDLFLFSKLDMQKLEFRFEDIRIRPFIADMMQELGIELGEKNVTFDYSDALDCDCAVRLDARRFYQVVRNIIDNAVKYGPGEKLHLKAKLYGSGERICLDIADNGPGIPAEHLGHIFERFYRADVERTKDLASTGLGLAISRELVNAHGGEITAASRPGEGTRFTVSIPYLKEASNL